MEIEPLQPISLTADNLVVRVDGYWLRLYAKDFLSAAKTFSLPSKRFSPIPYYLICHSIELSLKSFLYTAGFKKLDRQKLNHNLQRVLEAAEANGLSEYVKITEGEQELISKANCLYPKKEFEYFESLETIYDPLDFNVNELMSLAEKLIEAIEMPVMRSIFE